MPNLLSGIRLVLIPVFVYLLLVAHANAWAVAVLMFSGASDWADGKIARLLNQSSKLGALLDPAVDRLYMVTVPIAFLGLRGFVPWWIIVVLLARDVLLAAELPLLLHPRVHRTARDLYRQGRYFRADVGVSAYLAWPLRHHVESCRPGLRLGLLDLGHLLLPVVVRVVRGAGGVGDAPAAPGAGGPRKTNAE